MGRRPLSRSSFVSLASVTLASLAASCSGEPTPAPARAAPTELTDEVGVHDVTFLYPLPTDRAKRTSLVGAAEAGASGALLPKDVFLALPPLDLVTSNSELYHLLRVLSVRVDPCFPGLGVKSEDACKNQLRLVMQPVIPLSSSGLGTSDLAVHLFYDLTRPELAGLLQELVELRVASGLPSASGPVGVHPALAREGVEGAFAVGFRKLLLAHASARNLARITFMGLEQAGQRWRFGGFDREAGELRPLTIPLVGVKEQTFQNRDLTGVTFEAAGTSPLSPATDDLRLLLAPQALAAATSDQRLAAYKAALRIESPKAHSPDTIDCATCHVATAARRFAEKTHGLSENGLPDLYTHPRGLPLEGATVSNTNELRAFGYFGQRPSVSPRTVNETAEVVEHVNTVVRKK